MVSELLAGLFGSASQGLGQIQDERRRQQQLALQQRGQDIDVQERKRQAIMEAYKTLQPGQEVAPESAAQFKALGLGGLEAQGGKIIRAKSPQDELVELTLGEAQQAAEDRTKKHAVLDLIHNDGHGWFSQPLEVRRATVLGVGLDEDLAMTPQEKVQFSPQVAVGQLSAQARIQSAGAGRNPYQGQNAAVSLEKAARDAANDAAIDPITKQIDKALWQQTYDQFKGKITGQPSGQPSRGRIVSIKPIG